MTTLLTSLAQTHRFNESQIAEIKRHRNLSPKKGTLEIAADLDFISETQMAEYLQFHHGIPTADLDFEELSPEAFASLSYEVVKRYCVLPLSIDDRTLYIATSNPFNLEMLDAIQAVCGLRIRASYAGKSSIERMIDRIYQSQPVLESSLRQMISDADYFTRPEAKDRVTSLVDIKEITDSDAPVVGLVNLILISAVRKRASDIHIEPQSEAVRVRIRIDGHLQLLNQIPNKMRAALAARFKIISNLNITECRSTQDGRAAILIDGRKIDIRVSVTPTFYGEKIVLRLLDPARACIHLDTIGIDDENKAHLLNAIRRPQGMVLVTGPTGSGKTSTLYSALNHLIRDDRHNIVTIEDPIEYLVDGVNQIQLNSAKNVTFANALRSVLRQDPNVIYVGEIRDRETAEIAFRAAMTGHLVFSTLHTLNSVATIARLVEIGIEPFLISTSMLMIMAQRLLRVICPECKEAYEPSAELRKKYAPYLDYYERPIFYRGRGCRRCFSTGYYGRTAVFEMLRFTEGLRRMVSGAAMQDEIFRGAKKEGLRPLAEMGIEKVARGITTLEELDANIEMSDTERETACAPII